MTSVQAYIGIGSNLNNPRQQVTQAIDELGQLRHSQLSAWSPLYRSEPVGPAGQPDYVNAVAELITSLSPLQLLDELQALELAHRRLRTQHWGPRTLDLDLLLYGDIQQQHPRLILPHPHLHERAFVLQPLADINPELTIPGRGALLTLLKNCPAVAIERISS